MDAKVVAPPAPPRERPVRKAACAGYYVARKWDARTGKFSRYAGTATVRAR